MDGYSQANKQRAEPSGICKYKGEVKTLGGWGKRHLMTGQSTTTPHHLHPHQGLPSKTTGQKVEKKMKVRCAQLQCHKHAKSLTTYY